MYIEDNLQLSSLPFLVSTIFTNYVPARFSTPFIRLKSVSTQYRKSIFCTRSRRKKRKDRTKCPRKKCNVQNGNFMANLKRVGS